MASGVTYRDLLLKSRHGLPLWKPEPDANLPEVYTKQGISIGDLGLLTDDGGFDYLFNIHAHTHDPVNFLGTPPFFSPLPLNVKKDVMKTKFQHPEKACITRNASFEVKSIVGAGMQNVPAADVGLSVEFTITEEHAAMLVLPHGADRYDVKAHDKYKAYAFENAISWYKYLNQIQQRGARNGSLYLVTGCDKARSWGLAAGSPRRERTVGFSVRAMAGLLASGTVGLHASWGNTGGVESRHYPPSTMDITEDTNQCIFARGFVIGINENFFKKKWVGKVRTEKIASSSKSFPAIGNTVPFRSPPRRSVSSVTEPKTQSSVIGVIANFFKRTWASKIFSAFRKTVPTSSLGDLPEYPKPVLSPGSYICVHLLSSDSDIDIVLVHDDDWITATYNDAENIFTSGRTDYERLTARVLETCYPAIAAVSVASGQRDKRIIVLSPRLSPSSLNPGLSSNSTHLSYLYPNRDIVVPTSTFHSVTQQKLPDVPTRRPVRSGFIGSMDLPPSFDPSSSGLRGSDVPTRRHISSGFIGSMNPSASYSPPPSGLELPDAQIHARSMRYGNLAPQPSSYLPSSSTYPSPGFPSYDSYGLPGSGYAPVNSAPSGYPTPGGYRVSGGHPSRADYLESNDYPAPGGYPPPINRHRQGAFDTPGIYVSTPNNSSNDPERSSYYPSSGGVAEYNSTRYSSRNRS